MGLNIGIHVKKQDQGYMLDGFNPKGTIEEIEERFFSALNKKFPKGGFTHGWVLLKSNRYNNDLEYDFDLRIINHGSVLAENGHTFDNLYLAITEFIYNEFSHIEGIKLSTYFYN